MLFWRDRALRIVSQADRELSIGAWVKTLQFSRLRCNRRVSVGSM
ncbi:MAG: hypothetical protein WBD58_13885 [Geitlerinemataceae cyanobacterium]